MEKELEDKAIELFKERYDEYPQAQGYVVIDKYSAMRAFLYGKTRKSVSAFKTMQNIIRFLALVYFWPMFFCIVTVFYSLFSHNMTLLFVMIGFLAMWVLIFFILVFKAFYANKLSSDVIFIHY